MKRWIATVMSFLPLAAFAAGFWDGNAALQRGDSSFESGLFAVSDSFAVDTEIQVENLDNGKTARLTVSQGAPSQANILVLLSPRAADALGIAAGTVARVRVTLAARAPSDLASLDQDRTTNPDPEISPAVAMAAEAAAQETPAEAPAAESAPVEAAPVETTPVEAPIVEEAPVEETPAVVETPVETAPVEAAPEEAPIVEEAPVEPVPTESVLAEAAPAEAVSAEPTTSEQPVAEAAPVSEDEKLLQELASRDPQKQLFLPPREDEKFAYQEPVEPPPAEAATAAGEAPVSDVAAAPPSAEKPGTDQPAELPEAPTVAEEPAITALGIESVAADGQPLATAEPEAGLAQAEAPAEFSPDLSDEVAPAAVEDLGDLARLPVPEALPAEQKPATAAAPVIQPTEAKPAEPAPVVVKPAAPLAEPIAALPPATAPKTEPVAAAPVPQEPQPVPVKPSAAPQKAPTTRTDKAPVSSTAPYFVQLAAYSTESLASGLAASLSETYPVVVLAPAAGARQIYRVLIGPLNKAESGTLLRWFRYRGFPDAFVKQD